MYKFISRVFIRFALDDEKEYYFFFKKVAFKIKFTKIIYLFYILSIIHLIIKIEKYIIYKIIFSFKIYGLYLVYSFARGNQLIL